MRLPEYLSSRRVMNRKSSARMIGRGAEAAPTERSLLTWEKRKVVDLLPDCEAATLTDWLLAHPSVDTVARDRSITYRNGIIMGRPGTIQIADRWHLLSNLGDALERMIERLLQQRKTVSRVFPEANNREPEATAAQKPFETIDDGEWQHILEQSFVEMKKQACRRRLLPHLPLLPKPALNRSATTSPNNHRSGGGTDSSGSSRTRRRLDLKLLGRLCFRKGKLGEGELVMLFDARSPSRKRPFSNGATDRPKVRSIV